MYIYSYELSEDLFWFIHENKSLYDDLCEKSAENDLSIAEYVDKYKRDEFQKYVFDKYGFSVEYD